jgi:hypothetical protein
VSQSVESNECVGIAQIRLSSDTTELGVKISMSLAETVKKLTGSKAWANEITLFIEEM